MANAIYDFTLGWPITPHIGGGIGVIDVFRSIGATGTATTPNGTIVNFTTPEFSGSKWGFGYQAIAGIRYLINPVLAFDVDYRYLASTQQEVTAAKFTRTGACCFIGSVDFVKIGYAECRRQLDDDVWRAAAGGTAASAARTTAAANPSGLPGVLRLG